MKSCTFCENCWLPQVKKAPLSADAAPGSARRGGSFFVNTCPGGPFASGLLAVIRPQGWGRLGRIVSRQASFLAPRWHSGFTLVELLIVIFVLAIAGGLLIPSAQTAEPELLRVAGEVLAADLALARSLSVLEGVPYRVVFAADGDGYQLVRQAGNPSIPPPLSAFSHTEGQLSFRLSATAHLGRNVRVLDVLQGGSPAAWVIEFTPLGGVNAQENLEIVLGTIQGLRRWRLLLTVDAVTGRCEPGVPFSLP